MKICKKCNKEKELFEFKKNKECKQGVSATCNECILGRPIHRIATVSKICLGCNMDKSIEDYPKSGLKLKYRKSYCKTCINKQRQEKRDLNKPQETLRKRKIDLKKKYKLTIEEYNSMFEAQKGKCKICNKTSNKTLHVDHCHNTLKVRGLLCGHCNKALGLLFDNTETLQKAIEYLEESRK